MEKIYIKSNDNLYRYALGMKNRNPAIFFGINPSTATSEKYDKTIIKIDAIAKENNYDSWIMLNVYPQRATDPNNLDKIFNEVIHKENVRIIKNIIKNNYSIIAAWGNLIKKRHYFIECLKDIVNALNKKQIKWYSIGTLSKEGNPKHPLYLKTNEALRIFDIKCYIRNYNKK
jgi:hypothetical protein